MPALTKQRGGPFAILGLHPQVVGVVGRDGEKADPGVGERADQRSQYARRRRQVERPGEPPAVPPPFARNTRRHARFGTDDREFVGRSGDGLEGRTGGPMRQTCGRGEPTDRCAIDIQTDALRHHLDVGLLEAGGGTMVATIRTTIARLDARLVLLMHAGTPWVVDDGWRATRPRRWPAGAYHAARDGVHACVPGHAS